MTEFVTELMNIFKTMPEYVTGLFKDHTILAVIVAIVFAYVILFSNKLADKLRMILVLSALVLIVFSLISQSWPRITVIVLALLALVACRIIKFVITEIRIVRRNRRLEERALDKAAKRRGSWQNKQGYSGARKLIVEPEYIPEEMNSDEIADVIENELSKERIEAMEAENAKTDAYEGEDAEVDSVDVEEDFDDFDDDSNEVTETDK